MEIQNFSPWHNAPILEAATCLNVSIGSWAPPKLSPTLTCPCGPAIPVALIPAQDPTLQPPKWAQLSPHVPTAKSNIVVDISFLHLRDLRRR